MYIKELPRCNSRFGRIDYETHKLHITCGYEEVCPEDCIMCGGFIETKLELKVDTFIVNNKHNKTLEQWI